MLKIESIYKTLGNFQLKDINLQIKEGEYFVILGPSGTGKTIILEIIAGMHKPDKGHVFYDNQNITDFYPEERKIGFVYQDYVLFPHLTVEENIIFGLKIKKFSSHEIEKKLDNIVSMFGIEHLLNRNPCTLSGGEQQKVSIARALITSPKILLMDEPLSALDPNTKENFQQMIKKIHKNMRTTTIHITHDFNEALYLADRIAVMHNGKIIQVGEPDDIFKRPNSIFVADFIGIENIFKGNINNNKIYLSPNFYLNKFTNIKGEVTIAIRAEEVILSKEFSNCNYKNKFSGVITNIIQKGPICKLHIDVGIKFVSYMSTQLTKHMNMKVGNNVLAAFNDSAIHIF